MKRKNNYYWMYSKYAVECALMNPSRKIFEFLVEKKLENYYKKFFLENNIFKNKNLTLKIEAKEIIQKKIGPLSKYQGVALLVDRIKKKKFSDFLRNNSKNKTILIIDKLNDPGNFGSILRTAYAFGIEDILVLSHNMPEESAYISSIASGTLEKVNIIEVSNLVNAIRLLKRNNWWIMGLESKKLYNCLDIRKSKITFDKKALIIGSESEGIRKLVRSNCDILLRIPMKNKLSDSLNVVQATTIALYEISRV